MCLQSIGEWGPMSCMACIWAAVHIKCAILVLGCTQTAICQCTPGLHCEWWAYLTVPCAPATTAWRPMRFGWSVSVCATLYWQVHPVQHRAHQRRQARRPHLAAGLRRRVQVQLRCVEGAPRRARQPRLLGLNRRRPCARPCVGLVGGLALHAAGALALAQHPTPLGGVQMEEVWRKRRNEV